MAADATTLLMAWRQGDEAVLDGLISLYAKVMMLKTGPEFDFLRSDPEFQEMLRSAGVTP